MKMQKVCIIGASGKLGQYMVRHALNRGFEVVAVCREQSVEKLKQFQDRITIGTAQAVLDFAEPHARLIFSCGWHISRDGKDVYSWKIKFIVNVGGWIARKLRFVDIDDQVEACRRIFDSKTKWTVVRGSNLEEGESQGMSVWSEHVGDPILESNLTRRIDFALFMIDALENNELIQKAPAIVGCQTPSALAHKSRV